MLGGPIARPNRILRRYLFGILIAVEMLLSFSFFGYFHIEPISITVAYIPVLLAGALLGPGESTAIGAIFGLASMWKASAAYVMPADQLFSPLYSGSPFGSLMLSVGSRTLFALAVGLLYQLARRLRFPLVWVTLVSYLGRTIHSFFVYTAMAVFFPEQGYQPLKAFAGLAEPADIAADLITAAIVLAFCVVARSQPWQQFQHRLELSRTLTGGERRSRFSLILLLSSVFTIVSATAVTFYFTNRIDFVLEGLGVQLSDAGYNDVLHLQIQFLLGIVSLLILMVFLLLLYRQYAAYSAYEAKLDAITGVMTRRAFFTACSRALQTMEDTGLLDGVTLISLQDMEEINFLYQGRVSVVLGTANNLPYKLQIASRIVLDTDGTGLASTDRGTLDVSYQRSDGSIVGYFTPAQTAASDTTAGDDSADASGQDGSDTGTDSAGAGQTDGETG